MNTMSCDTLCAVNYIFFVRRPFTLHTRFVKETLYLILNNIMLIYTDGTDYTSTVQEVNFDPGANQTTISIPLIAYSVYEGSEFETFTVRLRMTGTGGVNIGTVGVTTVTLNENDCTYAHMCS